MGFLGTLFAGPIAGAFASAFGRVLRDMFGDWLLARKAQQLGRAETLAAGAKVAAEAEQRMKDAAAHAPQSMAEAIEALRHEGEI
ncbi:hypothetical protein [Hyphomonas sp.]|uniref:hypothetical protein n=1 Tax=Hyphomonas sp. TaxID=87 RepID=UPI0025C4D2C7|nr:hypothetical protein [Hyphomonas sp.]